MLVLLGLSLSLGCKAYETDQFSNRLDPLKDSTDLLNERVNASIDRSIENWDHDRDEYRVVNRIFHDIGGHHWVDRLERWAMKSPQVDRLKTHKRNSIYSGHPFWATRVAKFFGVGPTLKIDQTLVGSDKIGHFISQGRKYYRRYYRYHDEARAGEWSAYTERAIFGQMSTGSYSNADLVANYEGYLFYRSLFEDDITPGKSAILTWDGERWIRQRDFDFADHVNEYWDEALNINHYDRLLHKHIKARLLTFCDDFQKMPSMFMIENEQVLKDRYQHLQLRDTSDLRLGALCPHNSASQAITATAASASQQ